MKNTHKPEVALKNSPLPQSSIPNQQQQPQTGYFASTKNPVTRNNGRPSGHNIARSPSGARLNGQGQSSHSMSQVSRGRQSESGILVQRVVQLHERLKNIHHFYKTRIQDEKGRVAQRNEVFMSIVEEMQRTHTEKVTALRKMVEEAEGQKKDVGLVDERMNEIKGSIDEILKQSADLKTKNERLQRQINDKAHSLREKEDELTKLKEELMEARNELESFELLNLRENKRNKEINSLIEKTLESLPNRT